LLGRSVRTCATLSVVPKGATGRVVGMEEMQPGRFDLIVEWDHAGFGTPARDYFCRDAFEHDLVEA
jgi:hypothetical protein